MSDTKGDVSRWLSVSQAAMALRLNERTLRRRITVGEYQVRQSDGRLEVLVETRASDVAVRQPDAYVGQKTLVSSESDNRSDVRTSVTSVEAVSALERLLRDTLERASAAEQSAAMHQERSRNLEEETKRLRAQLALPPTQLETVPGTDPVEELRAKVDELTQQLRAQREPVPDATPRPWWQRWRRM